MALGTFNLRLDGIDTVTFEEEAVGAYEVVTIDDQRPYLVKRLYHSLKHVPRSQRTSIHELERRFRDECVLLSQLRHPNIVHFVGVVQYGSNQDDKALIMEYLDTDLARCFRGSHKPTYPSM